LLSRFLAILIGPTPAWTGNQLSQSAAPGLPSQIVALDLTRLHNCGAALLLNVSPGTTANATVRVTEDNPCSITNDPTANFSPGVRSSSFVQHWNNHDTLGSQTESANGDIQLPVTAVTQNLNSISIGGCVTLTAVECEP
jgi:hypothetical protein